MGHPVTAYTLKSWRVTPGAGGIEHSEGSYPDYDHFGGGGGGVLVDGFGPTGTKYQGEGYGSGGGGGEGLPGIILLETS